MMNISPVSSSRGPFTMELSIAKIESQELALTNCVYINPLDYAVKETDCCELSGPRFTAYFSIKASSNVPQGEIAMNELQRCYLESSLNDRVKVEISDFSGLGTAKRINFCVGHMDINEHVSISDEIVWQKFMEKYRGHILSQCLTVPLKIDETIFRIKIKDVQNENGAGYMWARVDNAAEMLWGFPIDKNLPSTMKSPPTQPTVWDGW